MIGLNNIKRTMEKLKQIHLDKIVEFEFSDNSTKTVQQFANVSTIISTDVAIKFAEWCNKPDSKDVRQSNVVYVPNNNFYWYNHKKYTPEELFEEFINNHYGK